MSKYGALSRKKGHSQWFLQKTLEDHDRSMDHPWMKMIYNQSFTVSQYCEWLARNLVLFRALEKHAEAEILRAVYDERLLRTSALELDLAQLGGPDCLAEAEQAARQSPATARYLEHLEADSAHPPSLLAHHFLQYNAVLSGGAYLGEMVSQKFCLPHGAPGVRFYSFEGVEPGKGPERVQRYLREFDTIELQEEDLEKMLATMHSVYAETEAMMTEVFDLNPAEGLSYAAAKEGGETAQPPSPCAEQLDLSLEELHSYVGESGGRILLSLAGELLDVSTGRELYGPGGGYSLLAGRDVTRCLATMCLEPSELDDLSWEPDNGEEEKALHQWQAKLKAKYPLAGRLRRPPAAEPKPPGSGSGLRQRTAPTVQSTQGGGQKCPISGKEGMGCPMSFMGIGKGPAAAEDAKGAAASAPAKPPGSGFMAGKSLVASVEKKETTDESLLYRLCPLHWDDKMIKTLMIVLALISFHWFAPGKRFRPGRSLWQTFWG